MNQRGTAVSSLSARGGRPTCLRTPGAPTWAVLAIVVSQAPTAAAETPAEARLQVDPVVQPEATEEGGLRFLGVVQARMVGTNVVPTNPFLDGQVVGRLGGTNATTVSPDQTAIGVEQRTNGFFTYAPKLTDGQLALTAGFELDFGYGDQSYGTGGNTGGGFGADQVNLQTRRMHVTFKPDLGERHRVHGVLGLQFVADSEHDPQSATPDDLFRTGGGLGFFGSEATGLTLFGRHRDAWGDRLKWRLGGYTLWERGVGQPDDVTLYAGDVVLIPERAVRVGGHVQYLRDRSGGQQGLLGVGPTSALSELQGGPRLDFRRFPDDPAPEVDGDFLWVTVDTTYNHDLRSGPLSLVAAGTLGVSGFYVLELPDDTGIGWGARAEARYRFLPGDGSVARLGATWVSDDDVDQAGYGGLVSGNSWGVVGAMLSSHGTRILFPDVDAINRQASIVSDVSNQGRGYSAVMGSVGVDVIPHRLNVMGSFATASDPEGALGTELGAAIRGRPWPLFDATLAVAAVPGARFDAVPFTVIGQLQWVVL
jgi:hypothetical protein